MRQVVFISVVLITSSSIICPTAAETIELRERVAMTASVVRLGDVAEIKSANRARARQLAALPLMPSPSPGSERFLRRREVEDLLAAHGQDLRELRVEGADQVAIIGPAIKHENVGDIAFSLSDNQTPMNLHAAILAGQTGRESEGRLDEPAANALRGQLQRAIERYLSAKTGKADSWQVSCSIGLAQLGELRAATSPITCQGGREPWIGRQRFTISFSTAQGAVQIPVYAQVSGGPATVIVAVRPIARGTMITGADVELQQLATITSASSRRSPVDSIENAIGMEARQAIRAGETVFSDQLQAPILVKRGEMITIVSQGGGIRVRTTALAREDGAKGDLVQVEAQETRERFDVRVTGPREAAIFVAGTTRFDPIAAREPRPAVPPPASTSSGTASLRTTPR